MHLAFAGQVVRVAVVKTVVVLVLFAAHTVTVTTLAPPVGFGPNILLAPTPHKLPSIV